MSDGDLPDLPCQEFVELVTDYLDDALPDDLRARVDQHLAICDGCSRVMAQWRETIRLTGRLAESEVDDVDPQTRRRLMTTFRQLRPR
ncbi:MAG: anti-sigma factor family protein [Acidimicrobiales bacterium]